MRSGSSFSDRGAKKKQTTMLSFFGSSQSPKIQNISHGIGGMAECDSPTSHGGVTSPMSMMDIQVEPDNNEHGEFSSPSKKNRFKTDQFSYDHDEFRREKRKSSHLSVSYSDDDSKNDPDFLIKQSCKVFKNLDSVSRIKQTIVSGNFSDECVQKDGLMSEFGSLNDEFLVADVEISEMSSQSFNFPPNQQRVLENSKNSASIRGYSYSGDVTNMEGGKCNILVPRTSIFAKTNDEGNENIQVNPDRYKWLIDVRDEAGRRPGEDGYDSRTLYIPKAQWNKFTPFERQFWEIKCKLYDTVVFFKKGKFYELYENDADVGAREFDLKVADRVNMRMAGVPEATFESWAARFVAAGYKIARVDQTETAMGKVVREKDAANASNKSKQSNSKESIIGRELKCILTSGTVSDPEFLGDRSNYCISLKFNHGGIIGMAAVDAAAGKFYLDDIKSINSSENCSVLEMVLRQMQPRELLLERGLVPSEMQHMIQRVLVNIKCAISYLEPVEFIQEERLFLEFGHSIHEHLLSDDSSSNHNTVKNSKYFNEVPGEIIRRIGELSLSALGGLFSYLKTLKLDQSLFSYAMFSPYQDKPSEIIKDGSTDELETALEMIIDGQVLVDLDVIPTASTSKKDTLLGLLDKCFTAPGKRLTERWILRPLRSATAINARLDAVEALMKNKDGLMDILSSTLTGAPDIERLLARAHTKAIKIKDFCSLIDSLQRLSEASSNFLQNSTVPLIRLISSRIPDFIDHLSTISQSFDRNSALIDGVVTPKMGTDPEFDDAVIRCASISQKFQVYKKEQEILLKTSNIQYKDMGKEPFQLEVPANTKVSDEYILMSKTKSVNRYWTPVIRSLVKEWQEWEERRQGAERSFYSRLLDRFDSLCISLWRPASEAAATLDALCGLARASLSMSEPKCRPIVTQGGGIKELRHPCLTSAQESTFVPNDVFLGCSESCPKEGSGAGEGRIILLTGPNMGGKSTLLRQTALAVILAQIGCFVPAELMEIEGPIDRIFTRLGASDNIVGGQSTFMVELSDAARILSRATGNSLVILDELGRGTSTYDGMAIARAVLADLALRIKPIGLFATHYRPIADEYASKYSSSINKIGQQGEGTCPVKCMYMSCVVEEGKKSISFLYRLVSGISPRSFGLHVARMAGLPEDVVLDAEKVSCHYEQSASIRSGGPLRDRIILIRDRLVNILAQRSC